MAMDKRACVPHLKPCIAAWLGFAAGALLLLAITGFARQIAGDLLLLERKTAFDQLQLGLVRVLVQLYEPELRPCVQFGVAAKLSPLGVGVAIQGVVAQQFAVLLQIEP